MPIINDQNPIRLSPWVKKIYCEGDVVYSSGNIVTYMVDANASYQEEVDEGESCLAPKTFTPSKSGWEFVGWREDTAANGSVLPGRIMGDDPVTLYAVFRRSVTVTYYNNSTTASSTSGYRFYNNGNIVNPSFTLTQAASSGWTARGWSTSNAGNAAVTYANGSTFTRDSDVTLYGLYQQTITVTYYNNSTTASTATGTRYWAPAGHINPSFTLTQAARSGWTARGWSTSTAGNGGISYNNGVAFTRDSNITLYGMYYQTVTLTYYNGSTTAASTSGTRYYNPGSGGVVNPTFSLTPAALSGWTFRGWATSSGATAGIAYSSISGTAFSSSATVYAAYSQTITLSYNGNGSTGGATAAQTGTRYYNTGNYSNPSFTVRSNGFSRSGYSFVQWRLNGTGGAAYSPGSTIALDSNATLYAEWQSVLTTPSIDMSLPYKRTSEDGWTTFENFAVTKTGSTAVQITPNVQFNFDPTGIGARFYLWARVNGTAIKVGETGELEWNEAPIFRWTKPFTVTTNANGQLSIEISLTVYNNCDSGRKQVGYTTEGSLAVAA